MFCFHPQLQQVQKEGRLGFPCLAFFIHNLPTSGYFEKRKEKREEHKQTIRPRERHKDKSDDKEQCQNKNINN